MTIRIIYSFKIIVHWLENTYNNINTDIKKCTRRLKEYYL